MIDNRSCAVFECAGLSQRRLAFWRLRRARPARVAERCPQHGSIGAGAEMARRFLPANARAAVALVVAMVVLVLAPMSARAEAAAESGLPYSRYPPTYGGYPPSATVYVVPRRHDSRDPLSLTLQFGAEGYTGSLAPRVEPGPAWGVLLDYRPVRALGLEFAYTGADNRVASTNQRLVRDGLAFSLRASPFGTPVEPFAFAGIGTQFVYVRNHTSSSGYSSAVYGAVPLGLGLDFHLHNFILGVRETYSLIFGHRFSGAFQGSAGIWNSALIFGGRI